MPAITDQAVSFLPGRNQANASGASDAPVIGIDDDRVAGSRGLVDNVSEFLSALEIQRREFSVFRFHMYYAL